MGFSLPKQFRNLDLLYQKDLEFWGCFGEVKRILQPSKYDDCFLFILILIFLDEVLIPLVLQCGGIQDNLHTPGLLFSNGGDKTKLHYNDVDYITCLLEGRQEFVLYDKV